MPSCFQKKKKKIKNKNIYQATQLWLLMCTYYTLGFNIAME